MKLTNLSKFILPLATLFCSTAAIAGDDQVNCRSVTSYQTIYGGWASCTAWYFDSNNRYTSRTLTQYYYNTTIQHQFLSQTEFGSDGRLYSLSCWVNVPFSHQQEVTSMVCDYTPKSNFSLSSSTNVVGVGRVNITDRASDRDGNIVKTEWWVDGVYNGTTKPSVTTSVPKSFSIRQKVTDDDGYTDESTRSIYVTPRDFDDCGRKSPDQLCP